MIFAKDGGDNSLQVRTLNKRKMLPDNRLPDSGTPPASAWTALHLMKKNDRLVYCQPVHAAAQTITPQTQPKPRLRNVLNWDTLAGQAFQACAMSCTWNSQQNSSSARTRLCDSGVVLILMNLFIKLLTRLAHLHAMSKRLLIPNATNKTNKVTSADTTNTRTDFFSACSA